jgi:GAF domain-containing protein
MIDDMRAAVAAGVLGSEDEYRSLLQSIVDVARAIFVARASSILLLNEETDELVFEAVAGEGSHELVGTRLQSSTGIAGWVLVTQQPIVLNDVQNDPRFSREAAAKTGFVPQGLMAVPLLYEEQSLGVLQVLDRPQRSQFSLQEMDLLGLFASQATIGLHLLRSARRAGSVLAGDSEDVAVVARLAAAVDGLEGKRRESGIRLLVELERLLGP